MEQSEIFLHILTPLAHKTLDGIDGILGIGNQIIAGLVSNDEAILLAIMHDRREHLSPLFIWDHLRIAALIHISNQTIGCTEIYTYYSCHTRLNTSIKALLRYRRS